MNNQSVYVPIHALGKIEIDSLLSVALPLVHNSDTQRRFDYHNSRRTMLYYLLSIMSTLNNDKLQNFIDELRPKFNPTTVQSDYNDLKETIEPYQKQYLAEKLGAYWELKREASAPGPKKSRTYISRYRNDGFKLDELKLYWNYEQIQQLNQINYFNPTTDCDTHQALLLHPVDTRDNAGSVQYITSGIESAVFKVPRDKQVIVLDFADERMPGGYFLENARTQEEVILYNSDGYRALLDLKYKVMDGGYMLPEYGLAYVKRVRFFDENTDQERVTDLIVAACYDVSHAGEGLYKPPSRNNHKELRAQTYRKFQSIIASAVANTEGNGKDTYLLLGPIGTGAFGNDMRMIAELFSKILNEPLMGSTGAIRKAFEQIWFVSIDSLETFADEFQKHSPS